MLCCYFAYAHIRSKRAREEARTRRATHTGLGFNSGDVRHTFGLKSRLYESMESWLCMIFQFAPQLCKVQ